VANLWDRRAGILRLKLNCRKGNRGPLRLPRYRCYSLYARVKANAGRVSQDQSLSQRDRLCGPPQECLVLSAPPRIMPRVGGTNKPRGVTGNALRRGTAGDWSLLRRIGRSSSHSPRGMARSEAPASPPGLLLSRMTNPSRDEPFAGREDVSLSRPCRRSRDTPSQRGRPRNGTGQVTGRLP
jgi:hypothetical protein